MKWGMGGQVPNKIFARILTPMEWVGMGCQFPKMKSISTQKSHISNPCSDGDGSQVASIFLLEIAWHIQIFTEKSCMESHPIKGCVEVNFLKKCFYKLIVKTEDLSLKVYMKADPLTSDGVFPQRVGPIH